MKIIIFCVTILLSMDACVMGSGYISGPSPKYKNLSYKPISNIRVKSGKVQLKGTDLRPGSSFTASNDIANKEDMYGDIVVSWTNSSGKEFTRKFKFTEADWKDIYVNGNSLGSYIVFEFTQDNVEYYTSAAPNYRERGRKSSAIMDEIRYQIDKASRR